MTETNAEAQPEKSLTKPPTPTSKAQMIFSDLIIRFPWLVICASVLCCAVFLVGAQYLIPTNDYRVFFSDDNPHLLAFDQQQKVYTKNDNVLIAITPNDGGVFNRDTLAAIEYATEKSWLFPFALRVDSLTNFQYSHAEADDLIVESLVEGASAMSDADLHRVRNVALQEPLIVGRLLNREATVTAVNITFQMPDESLGASPKEVIDANPKVVSAARALKAELENRYDVTVRLTGVVMLSNAFFEASMLDMQTLIPLMFLVIIAVLMVLIFLLSYGPAEGDADHKNTRRARTIAVTLFSAFGVTFFVLILIVLSIGSGMGAGGWMDIKLTPPSFATPTIIMTLAVADSVHFLFTFFSGMKKGMSRHDAIRYSLRLNLSPIFLTSVTTAIGFLSMNFSDTPPFHDLGNMTAIGVMVAFVLSVTLLPALLAVAPIQCSRAPSRLVKGMNGLGDWVIRYAKTILAGTVALSIVLIAAIPLNQFDDNFVGYFSKNIEFRNDTDYINDNLTGIYQIQYSLNTGEDYGVSDPGFLSKIEAFSQWLQKQPEVLHVNSFTDTFKRINKNMHADEEAYYTLPADRELAAQYLLLYELSLPEGLDLNNQMDIGKSSTQIIVTLKNMTSSKIAAVSERGRKWLHENQNIESYGVGPAVMFAYISKTNMQSMLVGSVIAILLISLLIMLALRSVGIGLISLVPNLLPLAASFGLWGIMIGEVNVAVSMVTGIALGIVVDDSVHFLSKYLRARREDNLNIEDAIRYAFSSVGLAIIITSVILVAGFSVLAMSNFGMNSSMAILTAIAIAMALFFDFLLLPVLLLVRRNKREHITSKPAQHCEDVIC